LVEPDGIEPSTSTMPLLSANRHAVRRAAWNVLY
jgi:hypothetical protein